METLDYHKPVAQILQDLRRINKENRQQVGSGISPLLRTESRQTLDVPDPVQRPTQNRFPSRPRNSYYGNRNWRSYHRPAMVNRLGVNNRMGCSRFSNFRSTFRYGSSGPMQDLRHRIITTRFGKLQSNKDLRVKLEAHRESQNYINFRKWQAEQRRNRNPLLTERKKTLLAQLLGTNQVNFISRPAYQGFMGNSNRSSLRTNDFFGQPVRDPIMAPPLPHQHFDRGNIGFMRLGSVPRSASSHYGNELAPPYYPTQREGFLRAGSVPMNGGGHYESGYSPYYPPSRAASVSGDYYSNGDSTSRPAAPQYFHEPANHVATDYGASQRYHVVNGIPFETIPRAMPTQSRQYGDSSWSQVHIESKLGMF